jgi:predicted nucleic acid-binding protein
MMSDVFLDTSYAIALAVETDAHHKAATQLANDLKSGRGRVVTTRAVMLEIGNALSRARHRNTAIAILESLDRDPQVDILALTDELFELAMQLFRSRLDKEWGLVDCVSFVVMQELELTDALTADEHFEQAGFRALLRND